MTTPIDDDLRQEGGQRLEPFGWAAIVRVAGVAIGMYGGFAGVFFQSFSVFVKPISASLGWGRTEVSMIPIMGFLGFSLTTPVMGALIDRFGSRRILAGSVCLFAISVAALGVLPGRLPLIALASFLVGALGAATAPTGYILVLSKLVRDRIGLNIGLSMLGLGLSAFTMPIVAQAMISRFGWHGAYLALAGLALLLGAIAWLMIHGRGRDQTLAAVPARDTSAAPLVGLSLRQALGSYSFWLIAITGLLVGGVGFGASAHLAAALSDRGLNPVVAARAAGLGGLGLLIGRSGAAILMDYVFAPLVAMFGFVIGGVGLYLLATAPISAAGILLPAAFMAGLLGGAEGDVMPILTRRYFGMASFGSIYGCIVGMASLGGIIGPLSFGLAFDRTGSYRPMLIGGGAICIACGLMMLSLGRSRYPNVRARPTVTPKAGPAPA